jgi:hypothetical protein
MSDMFNFPTIWHMATVTVSCHLYHNNNNQAFYSQASWGRLEMKPHEQKKRVQSKSEKRGKHRAIKKTKSKKGEKTIKR